MALGGVRAAVVCCLPVDCMGIYIGASVVNLLLCTSFIRCMHSIIYLVIISICVPCISSVYLYLSIDVTGVLCSRKCVLLYDVVSDLRCCAGCFPLICTSLAPVSEL